MTVSPRRTTVKIEADQRVLFVGKTGSGKTYLAEHMTDDIARLICFDPKPSLRKWRDVETVTSISHPSVRALRRGENRRIRVPDPGRGMEGWIPWYDLLWEIGDVTAYIDELNLLVYPKRNPSVEFTRLYQQGRERGIGMWAASQRPVNIPLICITEVEWIFMFRLGNRADRKLIADYGDDSRQMERPIRDRYGFWTFNSTWQNAVYTRQLQKKQVLPHAASTTLKLQPQKAG